MHKKETDLDFSSSFLDFLGSHSGRVNQLHDQPAWPSQQPSALSRRGLLQFVIVRLPRWNVTRATTTSRHASSQIGRCPGSSQITQSTEDSLNPSHVITHVHVGSRPTSGKPSEVHGEAVPRYTCNMNLNSRSLQRSKTDPRFGVATCQCFYNCQDSENRLEPPLWNLPLTSFVFHENCLAEGAAPHDTLNLVIANLLLGCHLGLSPWNGVKDSTFR